MLEIQKLQELALASGFEKVRVGQDGCVLLRKNRDIEANAAEHICIDVLTKSATVYWHNPQTAGSQTFRKREEMEGWLQKRKTSTPRQRISNARAGRILVYSLHR
ncbi:MAG: hypothetical protein WBR26_06045 [Candidatus Acidiferrum sp.]